MMHRILTRSADSFHAQFEYTTSFLPTLLVGMVLRAGVRASGTPWKTVVLQSKCRGFDVQDTVLIYIILHWLNAFS